MLTFAASLLLHHYASKRRQTTEGKYIQRCCLNKKKKKNAQVLNMELQKVLNVIMGKTLKMHKAKMEKNCSK